MLKKLPTIEKSHGVTRSSADSWVPRSNWVSIDEKELGYVRNKLKFLNFHIFETPTRMKDILIVRDDIIEKLSTSDGGINAGIQKSIDKFHRNLRTHLILHKCPYTSGAREPSFLISKPELDSTAYNYQENRYMGLHIDTHEEFSTIKDRNNACVLMAVNIGYSARYVNLVLLTAQEIEQKILIHDKTAIKNISHLKNNFFEIYPDQEVYRIKQEVGDIYILNTQNIIHDGSTKLTRPFDITLFHMGDLK